MPDVFISYSRKDLERVRPIIGALEAEGLDVFWDIEVRPGERFRPLINEVLAQSRCVVVFWSHHSVTSDWVIDEAEEGKQRGILIPVLLDAVQPPHGFRQIQMLDFRAANKEHFNEALSALINAVKVLVRPDQSRKPAAGSETRPTETTRIMTGTKEMRRFIVETKPYIQLFTRFTSLHHCIFHKAGI